MYTPSRINGERNDVQDSALQTSDQHRHVQQLEQQLAHDPVLARVLPLSLKAAHKAAKGKLNKELYSALDWPPEGDNKEVNEWYLSYLDDFVRLVPSEAEGVPAWKDKDGYSQEVFDRLCHFYWLIDQTVTFEGKSYSLQDYTTPIQSFSFGDWLVAFANEWGNFLNTPASLTPETLQSFVDDPLYRVQDSQSFISSWKCFNDFFSRELDAGLRPQTDPDLNTTITAPADCTFHAKYPIDASGNIEKIKLKKTHSFDAIGQLLEDGDLAKTFNNGWFVHYFLTPYNYHRFHAPVTGQVVESAVIPGLAYLAVRLSGNQFDAPDDSEDGYEFYQARGVLVIDTSTQPGAQNIGKVAVIPIGMAQVSSVEMTAEVNAPITKGDEFGHFLFGGSDIIMLFEHEPDLDVLQDGVRGDGTFKVGEPAVYWRSGGAH